MADGDLGEKGRVKTEPFSSALNMPSISMGDASTAWRWGAG